MDAGSFSRPVSRRSLNFLLLASLLRATVLRCGWLLCGLVWICIAATLCGCCCCGANSWVVNRSGQAYFKKGNYVAAQHEFNRAARGSPRNAHYAYNVAKTMEKQGDISGAEQMYQQALNINPEHRPSYRGLAALLSTQGREPEAQELLTAWTVTQPYSQPAFLELAALERRSGNVAGAQQHLAHALSMKPRSPSALKQMGQLQEEMGNPQAAAGYYQQSLGYNPFQPEVSTRLSGIRSPGRQLGSAGWNSSYGGGNSMQANYGAGQYAGSPMMMDAQLAGMPAGSSPAWNSTAYAGQPQWTSTLDANFTQSAPPYSGQPLMSQNNSAPAYSAQNVPAGNSMGWNAAPMQPVPPMASGPQSILPPSPYEQPLAPVTMAAPLQNPMSPAMVPGNNGMIPAGGFSPVPQGQLPSANDAAIIQPVDLGQPAPMSQAIPGLLAAPEATGPAVQAF